MDQLQIWKFGIDLGVFVSLLLLCLRVWKLSRPENHSARLSELENDLKQLIRDADDAGRALNEQLERRQSSLEKILHEFGSAETRLTNTARSAEQRLAAIQEKIASLERGAENIAPAARPSRSQRMFDPPPIETSSHTERASGAVELSVPYVDNPAHYAPVNVFEAVQQAPEPPSFALAGEDAPKTNRKQRLVEHVEREQYEPNAQRFVEDSFQHLEQRAEQALERVNEVQRTALQPRRAAPDVAAPIVRPSASESMMPADPRLGVLSQLKRPSHLQE